jgi:hypothetical protein
VRRNIMESSEPIEGKPSRTTFVYDAESGDVVHVHQFIQWEADARVSDEEMEEAARRNVHDSFGKRKLGVAHSHGDIDVSPENRYRVDVESGRVQVEPGPREPVQGGRRHERESAS